MAAKAPSKAKKPTARKSTAKSTQAKTTAPESAPVALGQQGCTYPGCSARAQEEAGGDKKVPSCSLHASVFNEQHDDGAGIEALIAGFPGTDAKA